jgi:hypothetical protein
VDVEAGVVAADVWTTVVVWAGTVTVSVWAGAVTVSVWAGAVTVSVPAGAVTVSVWAGAVTVSVIAGAVTVSVRAGVVTVSVIVDVVISAVVPVSVADPASDVVVPDASDSVVPLLLVVLGGLVDVVRVCVTLPATLWTFPEPHALTPSTAARRPAVAAHRLRLVISVLHPTPRLTTTTGSRSPESRHHPFGVSRR